MHIISKAPFSEAARSHPNHRRALQDLYRVLQRAEFENPEAMRRLFPSLDRFKFKQRWWVIDIAGNHLRFIAYIQFRQNGMYVRHILTHAQYDKLCWRYQKGDLR